MNEERKIMAEGAAPAGLDGQRLVGLYQQMTLLRRCELATQKIYREGKLPGFIHLYVGEEATAVGVCAHLRTDDWITSTHRGHGHVLAKGVPAKAVLAELAGRTTGCSGGRGGSMHMYDMSRGLFGTNGLVGGGIPPAVGLAISSKVRKTDQVTACFFGDGAVNHGAFHEAVNLAGIQEAPVIFVCENNQYATCTPFREATKNPDVSSKAAAYGIPGVAVDGNDVLAVWEVTREAVQRARSSGGPTLIESRTYRLVGHHEGDVLYGTYRTKEELEAWKARCPIKRFRAFLVEGGHASPEELDAIDGKVDEEIAEAIEFALSSPIPDPATANDHVVAEPINPPIPEMPRGETVTQSWLEAVRDGIAEEMRRDPHIICFGEGIGERGGSWGHTKNLWQEFGAERMIDTPISELGFTGAAIGASASGCRAISDLMVSDFLMDASNQLVHQGSRLRYMSNGQISVPVVIRSAAGTIKQTGPHHSAMYHPIWAHIPGLIVVLPSNPADAKGLIKTALRAGDPVIFHEHKRLLSTKGPVPVGEYLVPFGQAHVAREGTDLTVVSCGHLMLGCLDAANTLADESVSCEVIDLRSIVPLDTETILRSVEKTGRLLVVDEGYSMCGIGAEVMATVTEQAFEHLTAPAGRLHMDPVAQPFAPSLEDAVLVSGEDILAAVRGIMAGKAPVQRRVLAGAITVGEDADGVPGITAGGADQGAPAAVRESERRADDVPLIMPNQDLTVAQSTIVRWLKQVGDPVQAEEGVVEVETDKAMFEVVSPIDGTLVEILAAEGDEVEFGQQMATIRPG